ncbi:hypothetical protein TNCV_4793931 [Trichonephila clavipes]|nr:hypothetical protein TNCV_4793931 [Trichonephila clavipes]
MYSAFLAWGYSKQSLSCNSSRAVVLAEDEMWEAPNPPPGCSTSKSGWNRAKSYFHLVGFVQWTTPPPVLRLEQFTPRQECPTKGHTGKYADGR